MSQGGGTKSLQSIGKALSLGPQIGANRTALIYQARMRSKAVRAFKYFPRRPDTVDLESPNGHRADYLAGLERFVAMGEAWSRVKSPNVAPVLSVARILDDSSAWIVTGFDGVTLQARLDRGVTLSPVYVRRLALALSRGLKDLHVANLNHLNLSPAAILLPDDPDSDPAQCRLTGLAPDDRAFAKIFKTTRTLGETGYSPPELQDGSADSTLGPATDIYGASAVLFRLMTGEVLADWRKGDAYQTALQTLDRLSPDDYPAEFVAAVRSGLADGYDTRNAAVEAWHLAMESSVPALTAETTQSVREPSAAPLTVDTPTVSLKKKPVRQFDLKALITSRGALMAAAAVVVILLSGAVLSFCKPHTSYDLVLSGSSSVGEKLAPELVKAWLESKGYNKVDVVKKEVTETKDDKPETHPEFDITARADSAAGLKTYRVHIRAAGTGDGFEGATKPGAIDIVMASRQIKPKEAEDLATVGDFKTTSAEHVASLDGIAVVVSKDNPVRQLTVRQIHDIFTGNLTDWGQVGGTSGHSIHLYSRDTHSGTYDGFKSQVLGSDKMAEAKTYSAGSELEAAVAADPYGIGFASMSSVKTTRAVAVSAVAGNYFVPNTMTVRSLVYPLYRRLYFYAAPQAAKAEIGEFLQFVSSDAGQEIPAKVGQVGLSLVKPPPTDGAEESHTLGACELPEFWKDREVYCKIRGNEQARLVIDFGSNQTELSSLSRDDIDRLNNLANSGATQSIVLVGHTDDVGDPTLNRRLSLRRADAIKDLLTQQGWIVQTYGFGEDLPIAPNDGEAGRQKNRRVEVFIR